MRISVIIPVFNCEEYIEQCLDSVCKQSIEDLEVLCIDDGSADRSYSILDQYRKKDDRVSVLRQSNQGAGKARNLGLKAAKGEFVIFLDGDDYYIDADALEKMYRLCVLNQAKVCGSSMKLLRQGEVTDDNTLWEIKSQTGTNRIFQYREYQFDYGYTGFLFQRKMLLEYGIEFPAYRSFEDPLFLVRAMYAAESFVFSDAGLYCYRVPMRSSRYDYIKVIDLLKGLRDNMRFACEHGLDKLFRTTLMRLEYEYYSIICHWVNRSDEIAMQLLVEINHLVAGKLGEEDYTVRPLDFLTDDNELGYINYEENLQEKIHALQDIYIYGAGGLAKRFIGYLKQKELFHKIKGIIVSRQSDAKEYIDGVAVQSLDELGENIHSFIFIATGAVFHQEIIDRLKKKGIADYYILDSTFLEELEEG